MNESPDPQHGADTIPIAERPAASVDAPRLPITPPAAEPSAVRAWCYLVWLSILRQARARQMVWMALGLMALATGLIALQTQKGRWDMHNWRSPRRIGPTFEEWRQELETIRWTTQGGLAPAGPMPLGADALEDALLEASIFVLNHSSFRIFSAVLLSVFVTFLLPIWSLSFATEGIGGEREGGSLVWLFTRPLPRWAIYLAKFVALLPWSLGLNFAGFSALCLAAGSPGSLAFRLYWPGVMLGSVTFSALFLLIGAVFRRPAVVGLVYSFFLETIFNLMPGYLKRASISFYTRCMMYDAGAPYHVQPDKPAIYLPVDGPTAVWVLLTFTVVLLAVGVVWFSRSEYATVE